MIKLILPALISTLVLTGCGGSSDSKSETDKILNGYNSGSTNGNNNDSGAGGSSGNGSSNNNDTDDTDGSGNTESNKIEGVSSDYKTINYIPMLAENQEYTELIEREYKTGNGINQRDTVLIKARYNQDFGGMVYHAVEIESYAGNNPTIPLLKTYESVGDFLVFNNDSGEWIGVSQFDSETKSPRGSIASRHYSDSSSGLIFDIVNVKVNFQAIPKLQDVVHQTYLYDVIKGTSLYDSSNEVLDNFFKREEFTKKVFNSGYSNGIDTFALVKETLNEPLFLTWFNETECNKDNGENNISNMFYCAKLLSTNDYGANNQTNQITQASDVLSSGYTIPAISGGELKSVRLLDNEAKQIQMLDDDSQWQVIGSWKQESQPFNHFTLEWIDNLDLVLAIGNTGLKGGKTIIFENNNAVYVGQKFESGITAGELVGKDKHVLRMSAYREGNVKITSWLENQVGNQSNRANFFSL